MILPLPGAELLPPQVLLRGTVFARKSELHATFVGSRDRHPAAALRAAAGAAGYRVRPGAEFRLVSRDAKRSIVVLADVEGLEGFYARLEAALGAAPGSVARTPGHVTLFTACDPAGRGIALDSPEDLAARSEIIASPLAALPWRLDGDGAILGA